MEEDCTLFSCKIELENYSREWAHKCKEKLEYKKL
jgi:hypothetical protein